ncbi:MAG: hypothetical protein IPN76_18175 [Saprospiraceae bacterium]|nr:hypothetical protein [Saprospiraceae bacterium]
MEGNNASIKVCELPLAPSNDLPLFNRLEPWVMVKLGIDDQQVHHKREQYDTDDVAHGIKVMLLKFHCTTYFTFPKNVSPVTGVALALLAKRHLP